MTEQQPQEPYGDPQYESYREGTPTESVPTISMPTESIPITGASGPTGASRQRQAPQPHTPYGFSSATRPPTSGPYAPGPFPTPEARATQGSYEAPGPWSRTLNGASSSASSPFTTGQTNRQAHPPYQPYPMPPYQQYRPMQPPRKTGIGAGGITAIVAAVIVIPALLFIAVTAGLMTVAKNHISQGANEPTNSYGNASPSDPNQADPEPTATVYRMDERPGYESMVTYVTDKLDHYKDEILNNNTMFMSEYRIPDTQDGTDYMTGYMAALLGTVNEAKAAADETSEDPDALDAKIDSYRTTVDTLEARFKKGQALGVSMTVTGNDGKKYTVDGSRSITLRPTWDELEQRVAKASNSLGSGNAASAQKLVELADMKLSWDIDEGFRQCPAFAGTDDGDNKALTKSETFGFYCPATPNVIYGNRSMPDWNMTYAPAAGVRHELSHHAIHMRCGTIEPEAVMQNGVNRTEGVTNSYAVKYMGANRALIQQSIDYAASTGHKQYRMDAFTDRAAERIHSGQCNAG